ncbi:MAG TPA: hypothetical protein VEB68_08990 [Croceibacterium sp.]|nr:hypothetical protein [Croceibacterium sp.]
MGKYEPLAHFLASRNEDSWTATFDQIEDRLGFTLPKSAYEHRAWWSNQHGPGHSQKEAWQAAGWETREVDLRRKVVRFERSHRRLRSEANAPEIDALWRKAGEISGITDRDELEKAAVTSFIRREAARRLIAMGGTMPDFRPAPRERPFE